jgi:hypothetical protein
MLEGISCWSSPVLWYWQILSELTGRLAFHRDTDYRIDCRESTNVRITGILKDQFMKMKVKISKRGDSFEADPVDFPGSPPVGRGGSIAEALGDFVIHYQNDLGLEIQVDTSAEQSELKRRETTINQR